MSAPPRADRFLRLPEVLRRCGLSRTTLYRKIDEGTFPRQVTLGLRCIGWRESELDQWAECPSSYRSPEMSDPG
ncbi:helix-turn-helix transcriptional regulator [Sphingosinicella microcystinivorans]|uniref:helix-turn-helix transcriptional regulator n=1 Tax=Sphingosinicella microcystinivorans TaxID=335406 RepID=UPI0022F3F223|nr:AlpA family transcriptional regulator [Sphingosinicella microcystinivorans]WBX83829.1 AlpA family transcriptional regulator [Sphingosinicella microcystinivorans]